jgi:plasmid maintenance system antidote protein VapI
LAPSPLQPDWVVKPGEILYEHLVEEFAAKSGLPVPTVEGVLGGDPITISIAAGLARGTGISAQFWLNSEAHYRDGLAAGKTT